MTTQTEQQQLVARFHAMKTNEGLLDLKFFFGQVSESTTDSFCAAVNKLYRLVDEGKYTDLDCWGDGVGLPAR